MHRSLERRAVPRRGARRVACALAVAWASGGGTMGAQEAPITGPDPNAAAAAPQVRPQRPWRFSVRADNDAFNFWTEVTARPDEEYTNGDRVAFEFPGAPLWGKWFGRRGAPCSGLEEGGARCLTTELAIGHDMYTPESGREPRMVADWRDARPYAAWLYASAVGRVASAHALRAVGLTLGVTGPPALGEFTQRTAHALSGVYSRDPIGWDTQIAFEPGVIVTAREARRLVARSALRGLMADIVPHVAASAGNILTAAEAGVTARVGLHMSHPWWMSEWRSRRPFEIWLLGGARAQAVARDITLDGNTVDPTRRVERVPFVGEWSAGVGFRYREYVAAWRAVVRGREYTTGPARHAFSTLYGAIEVPARVGR